MKLKWYPLTSIVIFLCVSGFSPAQENRVPTIKGQVIDHQAQPVEAAEVAVYEEVERNDREIARVMTSVVTTDSQGRFEIWEAVDSCRYTHIVARKPGLAMAWDRINRYGVSKGKGRVLLVLDRPGILAGRVIDHQGAPVSGARVQAVPVNSLLPRLDQDPIIGPQEWFSTQTDSQGRFRFESFSLDVSSDFWIQTSSLHCVYRFTTHAQSCCGFEVGRPDIRLTLPEETRVEGRVKDAQTGNPVAGVMLSMQADWREVNRALPYQPYVVTSGADGRFVCPGLPPGCSRISLASDEQRKARWAGQTVTVDVHPDEMNDEVQVVVDKGGIIELSVHEEETNRPLSGFFARIYGENGFYLVGLHASGKNRLSALPGEYKLDFWHKNPYSSRRDKEPVLVKAGETSRVSMVMELVPRISGRIVSLNGQPAPGILVTVSPYGNQVYTDAQGFFQAEGAKDGSKVIARDFARGLVSIGHVKDVSKPIELRLKPGLRVSGQVVDPNGKGVPGARVGLFGEHPVPEMLTDGDGRFVRKTLLPPAPSFDDFRMSVHVSGFAPRTHKKVSIEGEAGDTVELKPIQLEPANMSVSGVVVDANGAPAPDVILFLSGVPGIEQPNKATATDVSGRFAFNRICKGPVRIQVNFSRSPAGSGNLRAHAGDHGLKAILGQDIVHVPYKSLKGKPLPELSDLGIKTPPADLQGKRIILCFFDMQQRPSRHCLMQLKQRGEQWAGDKVALVAIQTVEVDQETLDMWVKQKNFSFPVGMVQGDEEKMHLAWGVRSLPWLVLTDQEHQVVAEGISLQALNDKLSK